MINVALLGFGRIGQMHAENINKNKDLKLLYVYEKIDLLCRKAKKEYMEEHYKEQILTLLQQEQKYYNNLLDKTL